MKNIILLLALLFSLRVVEAQITLEGNFPTTSAYWFSMVQFQYAGDKYVMVDLANAKIQVYGLDQVLEKDITIPAPAIADNYTVYYISDGLFDLDSSIEYLVSKPLNPSWIATTYVIKEDGTILLEADSASHANYTNPNLISDFADVYPSSEGTKLILHKYNQGYQVYSLPGSLPCSECSGGVVTGNFSSMSGSQKSSLSNPFPNPTNSQTRIDYKMPDGVTQGELVLCNTSGVEVKRFKVTNAFNFIYVSAQDLPPGTYYCNLQTMAGGSDGKKIVVVK